LILIRSSEKKMMKKTSTIDVEDEPELGFQKR